MARIKGSDGRRTAERILREALPLIAQRGYSAVSMRMIAGAVGVNVGAIYNHFANKQQILVRLMSDHMDGLQGSWDALDASDLNPAEQLEQFVRYHIGYNIVRGDDVFISFMELRSLEPRSHRLIEGKRRAYEDVVRKIIRDGEESGIFDVEDAHVAAMSVLGSLIGVNTWYRAKGRLTQAQIEDFYVAMTLRSVGYIHQGDSDV
ncbi:TetR family transcriptional regulator [Amylibacter marinus]|uniref:TetR family transcriptional regulator n=1 Tax=Amylibacter marinus TaxID=1475483 RepID=A0ABQ5VW80_9RHOB|nr:TetR/AcrR family transcriptional regulator [Amylibacter marinus]GLQ35321.1 TetR family transcriptional regulator [Amylibacter marinus]